MIIFIIGLVVMVILAFGAVTYISKKSITRSDKNSPNNQLPDYCNGCQFVRYNDFFNVYLCIRFRNKTGEGYVPAMTQDNMLIRLDVCIKKYGRK